MKFIGLKFIKLSAQNQFYQILQMKIKTPTRPNFSRSAKLNDLTLYHVSTPNYEEPKGYKSPEGKSPKKQNQNYFFKSVPRQKRGNFRFNVYDGKGQYIYYPNFEVTKSKSPTWIFPKQQKYQNQKYVEYEFCEKHPLIKQNQQAKMKATQSMKSFVKDKVKMTKSLSMVSTTVDFGKNYSIINPRQTSPSGFFNETKIKTARYLSKSQLCNLESEDDEKRYTQRLFSSQRGFVDFKRQKQRKPNVVRKSFQYFVKSYDHQKQFNNYTMVKYPTKPQHHIDFNQHLDRPQLHDGSRLGPNPQTVNIDFSRRKNNNINYKLSTFRDKIKTRYDRVEPEPNTRLNIDVPDPKPKGMVSMEKVIARNKELFPIVDPIIKKAGDQEMKEQLKKHIFNFQINEAHKPYVNPDVEIRNALN